jgi:predicted dehydrogenase
MNGMRTANNTTTAIGIIGYGYWGSKHARVMASLPDVELHVIDANDLRREYAAEAFANAEVHADLNDVIDRLDGAIIATPAASHHPLAGRLLDAGVHTLVEKPLALSPDHARDLIDRSERSGATLMVGHTFEFNAGVRKVRQLIDSGELGEILYVDTARLNLGLYQSDVNVIWDLGPHDVSITNYLLRSTPSSVTATAEAHRSDHQADVATLQLRYDDLGITAYTRLSWLDPVKVRRVNVIGTKKMVVNNDTATERIRLYDAGVDAAGPADRLQDAPFEYRYGDIVSPHVQFEEPLLVEDRHFLDCIRLGKRPETDGYSGLAVVEVLAAAEQSIREGRTVPVGALAGAL